MTVSTPKSLWIHYHLKQTLCKYFTVDRKRMRTKADPHCPSSTFALQPMSTLLTFWICRHEFEFDVAKLNLPQWIYFATAKWDLPQWIWICRGEFEIDVMNLDFLQWIWNCRKWIWIWCSQLEIAVVNFNLP